MQAKYVKSVVRYSDGSVNVWKRGPRYSSCED
jgi:hypothetical protein